MRWKAWLLFAYGSTFALACGQATSGESDSTRDVETASASLGASQSAAWKHEVWTRSIDPSIEAAFNDVAVDAERNIYGVGRTYGHFPGEPAPSPSDYFVIKYDASGNELWARQVDLGSNDTATAVATEGTDVYVAATSYWHTAQRGFHGDISVQKLDKDGNSVWRRTYDFFEDGASWVNGISVVGSRIYISGRVGAEAGLRESQPPSQASVMVLNAEDGAPIWVRNFGDPAVNDEAMDLVVDAGGIYVAGWTDGAIPGEVSSGKRDSFVRKYDHAGNVEWTRQFGTEIDDEPGGIALYNDALYLVGRTQTEPPPERAADLTEQDAVARSYTLDGAFRWHRSIADASKSAAVDVAVNATGVYIAGSTRPDAVDDRSQDASIIWKLDYDGAPAGSARPSSAVPNLAEAIALDGERIYLAAFSVASLTAVLTRFGAGGDAAECTVIPGDLVVHNARDARRIADMTSCYDVRGGVYVRGAAGVKNLSFLSGLRSVGESLGIARNPDLQNLRGLENLQSVGDYLTIEGNPALRRINTFDSLVEVGGEVDIFNNQALKQIDFATLLRTPKLLIAGNDALLRVRAPKLERIARELHVENNDRLRRVEMVRLERVGQVRIRYNQALSTCEIEAFVAQIADVRGPVDIQGNRDLNSGGQCP